MRRPKDKEQGFTLVELMVAILISGIVSISLVQMLQVGQRSSERNRIMVESQQNARIGLESLASDLRHVSYGKDPTQPSIHFAGPDSVTFIADIIPEHGGAERISYFLSDAGDADTDNPNDTVLMKVVTDTAGVVLVSAPQTYGISRGGLSFRWFNGQGVELENPVIHPEQIGEAFVSLTAAASKAIGGTYPSLTLSETIYPRNLPLSPARSRPTSPTCGNLSYPNCESATMSWTTPTTNTDGTALPLADISHFGLYFGTQVNHQALYTKLARTINQWTINGLSGGQTYYISVTCVSRSGVESYMSTREADMSSSNVPQAVGSLTVSTGPGGNLLLNWGAVTHFTSGSTITTPISYEIYRATSSGFTPSISNRLATIAAALSYVDSTMADCTTDYYRVQAKACGNEGAASPEADGSFPAAPACPTSFTAATSASPGAIQLSWSAPSLRTDGSALSSSDISGYQVLGDTIPNSTHVLGDVQGAVTAATVNGLSPCKTYYVNLRCTDQCGHGGQVCSGNQATVFTSAPCNATTPTAPATCTMTPADSRVTLQWPTNHSDCDLQGYKIYYGSVTGGPYTGNFAAQGASPITVLFDAVTSGSTCHYDLTGLGSCQTVYAVVTAIDLCTPPNESARSPQANAITTCIPCVTNSGCVAWSVDGAGNTNLHLEIYTTNAGGETLTRMTPTYSSGAKVREVWYGRPLTKIWAYDGSAGQDGAVGPRASGSELNITDVTVPAGYTSANGMPVELVFDTDVRDLSVSLAFRGFSGTCTAAGTGRSTVLVDDFDDGNYTGWTTVSSPTGTWSVSSGELGQSLTSSNYILKNSCASMTDHTYEAKIKLASGGSSHTAYLVFRYQNASNYYLCGLNTSTDKVMIARVQSAGSPSVPTGGQANYTCNDNIWYTVRLVVTGSRVRVYVNCLLALDVTPTLTWASGGLGVSTRGTSAKFDDVKVLAGSYLP